jgi:hypothetical protein
MHGVLSWFGHSTKGLESEVIEIVEETWIETDPVNQENCMRVGEGLKSEKRARFPRKGAVAFLRDGRIESSGVPGQRGFDSNRQLECKTPRAETRGVLYVV